MRGTNKHRTSGFTLIELAMVIIIIGILLAVVLTPLAARIQTQKFKDQERELAQIKDALIGFAQTQGRLPCPDTDDDGLEDACTVGGVDLGQNGVDDDLDTNTDESDEGSAVGTLPFGTLGTGPADLWGRRYVYAVSTNMTVAAETGQPPSVPPNYYLDLTDRGRIVVDEKRTDKTLTALGDGTAVSGAVSAVILSLGANGFGGTRADGGTVVAPGGADEIENSDGDNEFITRIRTDGAGTCDDTVAASNFCEFDDLVVLIPTPLLLGKMVDAGQLP